MSDESVMHGGCACGDVRYDVVGVPLIVHACHCTSCQRLSGSAFGVNIWTEADNVILIRGELRTALLSGTDSGKPNEISFCPRCGTSVWSRYHASPPGCLFVRAGTLDDPGAVHPDVHIFTRSRRPWTEIPVGIATFETFYDLKTTWRPESLERLRRLRKAATDARRPDSR